MQFITLRALWTESISVIFANSLVVMVERTHKAKPAETPLIIRAVLSPLLHRVNVSVYALVTLLANPLCHEVLARRNLLFLIDMQILAFPALFALVVKPMNADSFLSLAVINLLMLRFYNGRELVHTKFLFFHLLIYYIKF